MRLRTMAAAHGCTTIAPTHEAPTLRNPRAFDQCSKNLVVLLIYKSVYPTRTQALGLIDYLVLYMYIIAQPPFLHRFHPSGHQASAPHSATRPQRTQSNAADMPTSCHTRPRTPPGQRSRRW